MSKHKTTWLIWGILVLTPLACTLSGGDDEGTPRPPRGAVAIEVVANASLTPWLEEATAAFNEAEIENSQGDPVFALLRPVEAGEAVTAITAGEVSPALWLPDETVWVNVLADQGNDAFRGDCQSVAQSPLVIAMWRPVAESLGWPGLPLGWLDVGSLAADPATWTYYSGGEFGDALRLGHTHPGLSGTGTATLLALVHAAEAKTEAVTVADIQEPIVQASVGAFESAVSWFSHNSDGLGRTMVERGVDFLGAAVMYESAVAHYGNGEIVPVYPLEGTFVASFPACVNGAADAVQQEAAGIFRDYLLSEAGQQAAVAAGLRPVSAGVAVGAPLDAAHGVDLEQPEVVFSPPSVDAIYAVQELWQAARKDVNLVMLLDTSGSMAGEKMDSAKAAAAQFVEQMGDDDYLTLIAFSTFPTILFEHQAVGQARDQMVSTIEGLEADGDTTLYDAIGDAATVVANTTSPLTTNAMVVLSDGVDTASTRYSFDQGLIDHARSHDTTVFTIAYGTDADEDVLSAIALQANGNFYRGDEATIAAIYEEMSAAFGGSLGVGR